MKKEERIEQLLEKYWEAETSLQEEEELKGLLKESEGYEAEKALFSGLDEWSLQEPELEKLKETKVRRLTPVWLNWAASVLVLISSVWIWQEVEQQKAEEEAYQEVMMALSMFQTNYAKGKANLEQMEELKYLKTTNDIFGQSKMK